MKILLSVLGNLTEYSKLRIKLSIANLSLVAALLFLSCNSKVASDIPAELISNKSTPSVEATDFETTFTDSGIVRYFLKTPKL